MTFKAFLPLLFVLAVFVSSVSGTVLYTETFTGDGDASSVGWTGIYNSGDGGLAGNFAWVWHSGQSQNLIYTNEYTASVSSIGSLDIQFDLRIYSAYNATPEVSVAVQVSGNWYVSKTVFSSDSGVFLTQTLTYDPAQANWDTLNITTASRGSTAAADLSGDITGFGLYSNNQNLPTGCTAEYDNFTIIETIPVRSPDFDGSGAVDFGDFAGFGNAWVSSEGQAAFVAVYDLDLDTTIDMDDLLMLSENWLAGAVYPYTPPSSPRQKLTFNTGWKFYRGDISGDAAQAPAYDDASWQSVNVPHAPVITPLRVQWPGPGDEDINWYRKHFTLDSTYQDHKIFIEFEGVDNITEVWVNGTHLTTHYGAYLPFTIDVTDYVTFSGDNVIAVKADETEDGDVPSYGQWLSSGGIYRDVWLHVTNKLHVTDAVYADIEAGGGIFVTTPQVSTAQATVQIKTHLLNEYAAAKTCTLRSYLVDADNMVVAEATDMQTLSAGGDHTATQTATVMAPKLWHPDHPNLYTLKTQVWADGDVVDTYQTRFGIRRITFSLAEGFTINGQFLKFRGANRVQDYPYLGWAMGNLGQRRDAELLREAGFNYIRTSHYPKDPAFLDACDELGILVMDEIPGFQYVGGSLFKSRSYQNMRDMIRRDRNRPCVIAWELSLNESHFDSTYAQTAMSIGHAEYPGDQCYVAAWKHDTIYDLYIATPNAGARSYSGSTPMIISEHGHWEYGGTGSTSDVHRATDITVDSYPGGEVPMLQQAWNHQESHDLNRGLSNMCGDGLWVGIDYGAWPSGVYDFLRLPKFSAYFWQSQRNPDLVLSDSDVDLGPMVHIANHWTASSPTDVKVFSNCEQVKLYINDVPQDTRSPDTDYPTANLLHPPFTFEGLTFQPGELKAEGLIDGQVVTTHTVRTPGAAQSITVEFDTTEVPANGSESVFVYASIRDSNDTVVPDASNNVTFSVSGQATLVTPATISAEAGIATALIRVTDQPGLITVDTVSGTLTPGSTSIISH